LSAGILYITIARFTARDIVGRPYNVMITMRILCPFRGHILRRKKNKNHLVKLSKRIFRVKKGIPTSDV